MKRVGMIFLVLSVLGTCCLPASATELELGGKSALLMDIETGTVLYEKNAHEPLPPASVTKVMTLLLIMEAIDSGSVSWEETVTASESAAAKGGSQIYLKVGETMSVSDMVKAIAVSSANDCACAMAEHLCGSESAFVDKMNARAAELGMKDTHFVNCTGLDDAPDAAKHLTSAYDIALMSRQLMKYHPDIQKFTTIWMDTVRDGQFGLSNTNKLIRFYPGATGLKTGFTSGAGYCLSATAQREGLGLIAVTMGCETTQIRTSACKAMLDYGFARFALYTPELSEELRVPVAMGKEAEVRAVPGASDSLLVEKANRSAITTEVSLEESRPAPVAEGTQVGIMTVKSGDQILARIPLVAENGVERLTWADVMVILLKRLTMVK